ncbi:hypothetical protein ACIBQ1_57125 [Nonomuraea sp. NPDC050153]|uniref:hypothetical protein n=1 Tax=Nonomuraea sp. NPDC050153 TaxID=3364359 RepID=UPI00379543BB
MTQRIAVNDPGSPGPAGVAGLCESLDVARSNMSVAPGQLERGGLAERFRP